MAKEKNEVLWLNLQKATLIAPGYDVAISICILRQKVTWPIGYVNKQNVERV